MDFKYPAPLDKFGKPETTAKIIIQALSNQLKVVPTYNKVTDTTTFEIEFPQWLKKNYSNETVKQLVFHMTPVIKQVISEMFNTPCLDTCVEGV